LLILVAWIALASGPAAGQCVGPEVDVPDVPHTHTKDIPVVRAGQVVRLVGQNFYATCNDLQTFGTCTHVGLSDPLQEVEIGVAPAKLGDGPYQHWQLAGPTTAIATVDADDNGAFSIDAATMPTEPGRYFITMPRYGQEEGVAWLWVK
jgi:hypothetical protein